jgi:hypothetical protein
MLTGIMLALPVLRATPALPEGHRDGVAGGATAAPALPRGGASVASLRMRDLPALLLIIAPASIPQG